MFHGVGFTGSGIAGFGGVNITVSNLAREWLMHDSQFAIDARMSYRDFQLLNERSNDSMDACLEWELVKVMIPHSFEERTQGKKKRTTKLYSDLEETRCGKYQFSLTKRLKDCVTGLTQKRDIIDLGWSFKKKKYRWTS